MKPVDLGRQLSDNLTVDAIAALTDAEMVRRRFDRENIRWLGVLSTLAFITAFIQLFIAIFHRRQGGHLLPLSIAHFLFAMNAAAFFGELAYAERRRDGWKPRLPLHLIARNFTPWVLTFLVVEFTFLTFFRPPDTDSWLPWAMIFPWFVIPVRLDFSRRAGLHVSLLGILFLNVLLLGTKGKNVAPEFLGVIMMSGFALMLGTAISRRIRRQTIEEWTERRTQAREQMRMRNELQYAREVQLSMLPESAPAVDWLDLAGTSLPASEVGGDYYDYFVDEGSVTLVCGDVAGHGLASGIVLAALRSGFTLLRESLNEPAAVLQRLSDLVAQTSRRRMLATAAVVRLDRAALVATIASAGHPPVVIRRSGAIETIELFAPPLGVRLPYRVPSREIPFGPDDVFVLHSDGVYESQNEAGESYGLERLSLLLSRMEGAMASTIRDAIVGDVETFRAGTPQHDDITVVVARVR